MSTCKKISLCSGFEFAFTAENTCDVRTKDDLPGLRFYKATVPGNIELDLFDNGLLADPYFGMNAAEVNAFCEKLNIFYTKEFTYSPDDNHCFLVLEGIDCYASVCINGRLVKETDNMLIPYEIPVDRYLKPGNNELFIHIRPSVSEAKKYEYNQLLYGMGGFMDSLHLRKAPHSFGWDIMPRLISAGIYRDIYLETRPKERLLEANLKTKALAGDYSDATQTVFYHLEAEVDSRCIIRVSGQCGEHSFCYERPAVTFAGTFDFKIENPLLWWPRGKGSPNLYKVKIELIKNGLCLDTKAFDYGIRLVRLERTSLNKADNQGKFLFYINYKRIFAKGTNWVPLDAFHSKDAQRLDAAFALLLECNCNIVRCWGGNVYESDRFYSLCDQNGIMVWQDFAMACAFYPDTEDFRTRLREEVACVVKRLRLHPSIVLWSGDNECDIFIRQQLGINPNLYNPLTREDIPKTLIRHDNTRPYIASSPFIDETATNENSDTYFTENHLWGPRDYYKSPFYKNSPCNFVSEIGYHGCPAKSSIERFISPEKLWPILDNNDEWIFHSISPLPGIDLYDYRVKLMFDQIGQIFKETPEDLESFYKMSQVVQAEAKKFFVELFRTQKWNKTGVIWWNLLDGWPQMSDAVVDYYFKPKLAFEYIKKSQQDVIVAIREVENWDLPIVVCNDSDKALNLTVTITEVESGQVVFEKNVNANADEVTHIGSIRYARSAHTFYLLEWSGDLSGANHYFAGEPGFHFAHYTKLLRKSGIYNDALKRCWS